LTLTEKTLLAVAGTGGVFGFVAILMVAGWRAGFTLRPRWVRHDPELSRFSRLAVWGVALHSGAAMLLGASLVAGNGVAGGVVAYQVAFTFFLAPYAVLAQPIHTAILPQLANEAATGDLDAFSRSIRWALDRMALLVIPVSAGLIVIALPMMRLVAFGSAAKTGPVLLAAGMASLALGLYPYGAFLLLARSYYALGDSRTPAIVAIATALVGVVVMIVGSHVTHGAALVAALGIGNTVAYLIGVVMLGIGCRRRTGQSIIPGLLPISIAISGVIAFVAWIVIRAVDPSGRLATIACLAVVGGIGTGVYALSVRRWWRTPGLIASEV
jgi:putative peptidoglycan lipid II flippase